MTLRLTNFRGAHQTLPCLGETLLKEPQTTKLFLFIVPPGRQVLHRVLVLLLLQLQLFHACHRHLEPILQLEHPLPSLGFGARAPYVCTHNLHNTRFCDAPWHDHRTKRGARRLPPCQPPLARVPERAVAPHPSAVQGTGWRSRGCSTSCLATETALHKRVCPCSTRHVFSASALLQCGSTVTPVLLFFSGPQALLQGARNGFAPQAGLHLFY
jgi:hypothetical protein